MIELVRAIEVRPGDRVMYRGEWRDVDEIHYAVALHPGLGILVRQPTTVYLVSEEFIFRADGSEVVRVLRTLDGDEVEHRPRRTLVVAPDRFVRVERAEWDGPTVPVSREVLEDVERGRPR